MLTRVRAPQWSSPTVGSTHTSRVREQSLLPHPPPYLSLPTPLRRLVCGVPSHSSLGCVDGRASQATSQIYTSEQVINASIKSGSVSPKKKEKSSPTKILCAHLMRDNTSRASAPTNESTENIYVDIYYIHIFYKYSCVCVYVYS